MFYVLIDSNGLRVQQSEEMLTLNEMQNFVGIEGQSASIEVASYCSFRGESIAMICDEEFLLKKYDPTCATSDGVVLHGQVLIVGISETGEDFVLLTKNQIEIVKSQVLLVT